MKLIKVKDDQEVSRIAGELLQSKINSTDVITLGLATGATPVGTYQILISAYKAGSLSFKHVHTVNLDEYIGLRAEHPNSYHTYMKEHLFQHVDIPLSQTHIPNGMAPSLEEECQRYEATIHQLGGIDLQILGVGINGHIGFNEPGTSFHSRTHVVKLSESTRMANQRFFQDINEMPTHAITMGIATIIESREILLLAHGSKKADIVYKLYYEPISEKIPVTILKNHSHVTLIADEKACSLLSEG